MLYLVYVGNGTDLLISDENILVNCFSEDSAQYTNFVCGVFAVAKELGGTVQHLSLNEGIGDKIEEMLEELDLDSNNIHIVKFILENSTESEADD